MRSKMTAPVLEPVGQGKIALQAVNVEAHLENLLCEVTIRQVYSNLEKINIEAVYTFPLPLGAVLLALTIKTQAKELKGVVVEKSAAEERYEEAVTDGDTAIMLEQVEAGLYTMNVGNLQPDETIEISMTYAELFKWRDNALRFYLPTTVAPRYGDTESAGIQPHQAPEYDLGAENNFSILLTIHGALAGAAIDSPSHKISLEKKRDLATVALQKGTALMDRDFVLNIDMPGEEKSFAHLECNADGCTALASFYPRFPSLPHKGPRCITIIVDCSGSMGGDSMAQARSALGEILDLLRPEDQFNVIRFGSSYKMLFAKPVPADHGHLRKAKDLLETMEADMGGTEIGNAIAAAIKSKMPREMSREVLLITDGEVWDWEKITATAAGSGFRFFTVGVGSSVSEAFVQTLAETTGGACELVAPNEGMAEKIVRHFKRIYLPKAGNVRIVWPGQADQVIPGSIGSLFDGDTLHVFGRFKAKPSGDVMLQAELENGEAFTQKLRLQPKAAAESQAASEGTTTRMAVAWSIRNMVDAERIAALGVAYQLMTRHTNYLAIDAREGDDKAKELPALRKTPQMLAAGWGGTGTILQKMRAPHPLAAAPASIKRSAGLICEMSSDIRPAGPPGGRPIDDFIGKLDAILGGTPPASWSLDLLRGQGLDGEAIRLLAELRDSGAHEQAVVVAFLYLLSQEKKIGAKLSRTSRRVAAKAFKQLPMVGDDVLHRIRAAVDMLG